MGKKKGGKLKWVIIVVLIIAVIGAVSGGSDDEVKDVTHSVKEEGSGAEKKNSSEPTNETEKDENQEKEGKTEFYLGETAEQKNVQITLANVTESSGNDFAKPDEGNVFLICEFEIANNSEKDISISSVMNFEAYCDDYSINQDIMGLQAPEAEGKNQLDGSVAAGKKMNGVIAYQVPADYKTMEINVSPDFWSSNDMKFIHKK